LTVPPVTPPSPDEQSLRAAGVATDGPGLLAFFRRRTPAAAERAALEALVRRLGGDRFADRQEASRQLRAAGPRAAPLLVRALRDDDPEVARRAEELLRDTRAPGPAVTRAAVRLLARLRPEGTVSALLAFLPFS